MEYSPNYFLETPVYKLWIDAIDIIIPTISTLLTTKSYGARNVICSRSGVQFFYSNGENELEILYSLHNRKLLCVLRCINGNKIVSWKNIGDNLLTEELSTKSDLIKAITLWSEILKKELQ